MKPLIIYHSDCTDGFGAAFAAWMKFGDEAEYLPMSYGDIDTHLDYTGRDLYVLDFSFNREVTEHMIANTSKFVWLDHHKTAFEMWCGKYSEGMRWHELQGRRDETFILLDDNKSGALLAWEYFHSVKTCPMVIQHIDDRDRWKFKLAGSKEMHAALGAMKPWNFELWEDKVIQKHWYGELINQGAAILRAQDAHVKSIAKHAMKCRVLTPMGANVWEGLAVNSIIHQSEVGHELANASGGFGLSWYLAGDGRVKCSFRSNGDYDVSAIARAFGGGGHRNAAGCEVDVETLMGWLR